MTRRRHEITKPVVDLKHTGDSRLSRYAKRMRFSKSPVKSDIPKFKKLLKLVWEQIMIISSPGVDIPMKILQSSLNIHSKYLESAFEALEKAEKIRWNRTKKTVSVIYK